MPARTKERHEGRAVKVTTPTLYGSHRSMVVKELDNGKVVCEDDLVNILHIQVSWIMDWQILVGGLDE